MNATLEQLRAGQLAGATHIKLSCGLRDIPSELFALADSLEFLDLSGNEIFELPDDFRRFTKLKVLFLSNNRLKCFPKVLALCHSLRMVGIRANEISDVPENAFPSSLAWLTLTDNRIEQLPASIGKLKHLRKLLLSGNKLTSIPQELLQCKELELVRLSANRFASMPSEVLSLPKLAWIALAGNPFTALRVDRIENRLDLIRWDELDMKEPLGSGASGVTYRAYWVSGEQRREVAVKLFKGEVTSDGLPEDECRVHGLAGHHRHLVTALGCITDHPEGRQALVFDIIPPRFSNLAGPPSFETCTRDVYADARRFSCRSLLMIASGIAEAARHIHAKGIVHGDLYAHNILVDQDSHALLGDFGAAMQYDKYDRPTADGFERVEVRAFGILLEELACRTVCADRIDQADLEQVRHLAHICVSSDPGERPSFAAVCEHFQRM